jgi:hypothetical protein
MVGSFPDCCACTASGHAADPPRSSMNLRRSILPQSITSSAYCRNDSGMVRPSCFRDLPSLTCPDGQAPWRAWSRRKSLHALHLRCEGPEGCEGREENCRRFPRQQDGFSDFRPAAGHATRFKSGACSDCLRWEQSSPRVKSVEVLACLFGQRGFGLPTRRSRTFSRHHLNQARFVSPRPFNLLQLFVSPLLESAFRCGSRPAWLLVAFAWGRPLKPGHSLICQLAFAVAVVSPIASAVAKSFFM